MIQMSYIHIDIQIWQANNPNVMDQASSFMVLVMKLSSYAWSVYDGSLPVLQLDAERKELSIRKRPSILAFFGYSLFFLGVWTGPAFEFNVYSNFVKQEGPFKQKNISYSRFAECFLLGIIMLGTHFIGGSYGFNFASCTKNEYSLSFWPRIAQLHITAVIFRLQYVGAWKLMESICCTTRLAYNGIGPKTNRVTYDRAENVNILGVEYAENAKMLTDSWNKYTHLWLKRTVYTRFNSNATIAQIMTYLTSAFWHGFYRNQVFNLAGYYLSFLSGALVTACGRTLRKEIRPLFITKGSPLARFKFLYDILGSLLTVATMSYVFAAVGTREWKSSLELWKETGFLGHLLCIGTMILLDGFKIGQLLQKLVLGKKAVSAMKVTATKVNHPRKVL